MDAELLVTHRTVLADAATGVVMADDPIAHLDSRRRAGGELLDDSTRLVAGNHVRWFGTAVSVEVSAA